MTLVQLVPGPTTGDYPYKHRDMKTYRHYAYAVAEMTGTNAGLMIMDMQYLPDSVHFVGSYQTASNVTSHNFSIDTTRGYAYILKSNYTGFRIVSLQDPENPVDVGSVTTPSIHDVYARNDTVWVAEGYSPTFSMYDVSNKTSPTLILRHTIPASGYVHNIWPTDDGKYAITTEETGFKTVKIWDVSDPGNVTLVGEYLASSNLAHNVQVMGNLVCISHYESGITMIDISTISNPVEIAAFDTFLSDESAHFHGCWGAYPYTRNGYFYASDIEGYLTVLRLDTVATGADPGPSLPVNSRLDQNFPNPFNPSTKITYTIGTDVAGHRVSLRIYNLLGQEVATLVNERGNAGTHEVTWDASGQPSGLYFYRLEAGEFVETRKMAVVK
jgi:choice-of-anchor B domain-containing protein